MFYKYQFLTIRGVYSFAFRVVCLVIRMEQLKHCNHYAFDMHLKIAFIKNDFFMN